jgi:hypothetical protein
LPELVFSDSANIRIKVHITGKNLTVLARKNFLSTLPNMVTGHTSPENLRTKFQKSVLGLLWVKVF